MVSLSQYTSKVSIVFTCVTLPCYYSNKTIYNYLSYSIVVDVYCLKYVLAKRVSYYIFTLYINVLHTIYYIVQDYTGIASKRHKRLFLISAICILQLYGAIVYGQNKYDHLLGRSFAELYPLFDTTLIKDFKGLSESDFDKQISEIESLASEHDDLALQLQVKLTSYYYLAINNKLSFEQMANELHQMLEVAREYDLKSYEILLQFELGGVYFHRFHDYNKAFTQYIQALSRALKQPDNVLVSKKAIVLHTGNAYMNFGDLVTAERILKIADTLPDSWKARVNIQSKNSLGLIYRKKENYDTAIRYFKEAINIAEQANDDIWVAIAKGNIGISYYLQKSYRQAIPLLAIDAYECIDYGSFDNAVNSLIKLSDSYLELGKASQAEKELKLAWHYVDSMEDRVKYLPIYYQVMSKHNLSIGNYRQALVYRDSSDIYRDSLQKRDNIIQLARVQNRINQELYDKELERLTVEKELISTVRNALVLGLILLSIIAYLVINRQRLKHKNKQQKLLLDKELYEANLENAKQQLDNFTKRLQEKNALIEKSEGEIERLQTTISESKQEKVDNTIMQQLYSSTILTDDEWEEFKLLFDKVHAGFLHRLKEKMPELSPADTRFLVLTKLKLTNKEMASVLGVQPDTIRSYKHRLRKKFMLGDDTNMQSFVDSI